MSDLNPSPSWKAPPRTLKGALRRLEELQQHVYWLNDEIRGARYSGESRDRDVRHYQNLLERRWSANDARLTGVPCDCGAADCTARCEHNDGFGHRSDDHDELCIPDICDCRGNTQNKDFSEPAKEDE